MRLLYPTTAFKKDLKRQKRRGKDLVKLTVVIEKLMETGVLPFIFRPHKLKGNWDEVWECHIEPDWLLIYEVKVEEVRLIRTGTHSDLF